MTAPPDDAPPACALDLLRAELERQAGEAAAQRQPQPWSLRIGGPVLRGNHGAQRGRAGRALVNTWQPLPSHGRRRRVLDQ